MARSLNDSRKQENQRKCGANRRLTFQGAVAKDEVDSLSGKDVIHLILQFSDGLSFRIFDPRLSVGKKRTIAETLSSLCDAVGLDWNDMPVCFGWEDFAPAFVRFIEPGRRLPVYAKVTLNAGGWPTYGTGRCFSREADMIYSDADLTYLDTTEGDLAHAGERVNPDVIPPPDYTDLPF